MFKYLLPLLALLLTNCSNAIEPIIPKYITEVFSINWPISGGFHRVIVFNTEEKPCITVESFKYGYELVSTQKICPNAYTIFDQAGTKSVIKVGYQGFYLEGFEQTENAFSANIEVYPAEGSSYQAECKFQLVEDKVENPVCKEAQF